jgi:hypothetical protein
MNHWDYTGLNERELIPHVERATAPAGSGTICAITQRFFRSLVPRISGFAGRFSSQRTDNVDLPIYRIGMSRI